MKSVSQKLFALGELRTHSIIQGGANKSELRNRFKGQGNHLTCNNDPGPPILCDVRGVFFAYIPDRHFVNLVN